MASAESDVTAGPWPAPSKPVVLAVDDEPDMLENLARIFRRSPYLCMTAANGQDALAIVQRCHPDLILTDLRMPGMDGLALLRAAKRLAPATPVLVFTAYASESAASEAAHAGAAAFITKPFSGAHLLQSVERALGQRTRSA